MKTTAIPSLLLALAGLSGTTAARADYTDNLLVGWTFNDGTLTSDLGTLSRISPVTFTKGGTGGSQTTVFNEDGSVSLGTGCLLSAPAINSTAYPELLTEFTLWVRVRLDSTGTNNAVLFGLTSTTAGEAGYNNRSATLELANAATGAVRFYGRTSGGTTLSRGSGFTTVSTGEYLDIAIRVRDNGTNSSTYGDWVDETVLSGNWSGSNDALQSVAALALGRINNSSSVALTFDEVRLYTRYLSDAQLAAISTDTAMHEFGLAVRPQSYTDHEAYCDQLIAAGVKWVRLAPEWGSIEPAKGQYNANYLAKLDAIVNRLHAADVKILWILCYTAPWASSRPELSWPAITRHKPQNWTDWEDYVDFIVARYAEKITHWEVWNEPDHLGFWKDSVADYHELLLRAHQRIKSARPDHTVLMGGLAMTTGANDSYGLGSFLDQLLALIPPEAAPPFDVFNYHAYGDYARHVRLHKGMRDVIEAHDLQPLPVWITETGYSTGGDSSKEAVKADMVDQIRIGNLRWADVTRVFWHCYHNPALNPPNPNEENFGLVTSALQPLQAFYHYQALGAAETDFALQAAYPGLTPQMRTLHHHVATGGDGSLVTASGNDRLIPAGSYMYFRVADDWLRDGNGGLDPTVEIDVTFLDSGTSGFALHYDSTTQAYRALTGSRTNTGRWKTATFALSDVKFANRQNNLSDFRLYNPPGATHPLTVRRVAVRKSMNPAIATLGATPRGKLMSLVVTSTGDGITTPAVLDGVECRSIDANNRYAYFRVSDAFARAGNSRLDVSITFWDAGTDRLALQYNATGNAYQEVSIGKTGTDAWRTVTVPLHNANFVNAQNYYADFRISNGWDGTSEFVSKVAVTLHPTP